MTDKEYQHFLTALARKHLRCPPSQQHFDVTPVRRALLTLKLLRDSDDWALMNSALNDLRQSPVTLCTELMDGSGILDALDDAHELVLGELRPSCIPSADANFLRTAGFEEYETEVLIALAIRGAHAASTSDRLPSNIAADAEHALTGALTKLQTLSPVPPGVGSSYGAAPLRAKRKYLNGIGKLISGAVAGIGNVKPSAESWHRSALPEPESRLQDRQSGKRAGMQDHSEPRVQLPIGNDQRCRGLARFDSGRWLLQCPPTAPTHAEPGGHAAGNFCLGRVARESVAVDAQA
jgi:hypothetical protein